MKRRLDLEILAQPDDQTCGPTCLHAVYRFHGDHVPLGRLIAEIAPLETGGTLAVQLACHALRRGYDATIYTYNLLLFDPTWFTDGGDIAERLRAQAQAKADPHLQTSTRYYLDFFSLGGRLHYEDLTPDLIRRHLERGHLLLTGLSATYLYRCARERGEAHLAYDDVRGVPTGHFVVLYGLDAARGEILIADPFHDNPGFGSHHYSLPAERVIGAIFLGVMTWDANILIVTPRVPDGLP
jgi:hypothetical protein